MTVIQFPHGGRDLVGDEPRRVKVSDVRALLPVVRDNPDLEAQLQHAINIQVGGYCYLGISLERYILECAIAGK